LIHIKEIKFGNAIRASLSEMLTRNDRAEREAIDSRAAGIQANAPGFIRDRAIDERLVRG
jgi:hypothetical protein